MRDNIISKVDIIQIRPTEGKMDFQDYDKPAGKLIAFGYADVKVSEGAFFEAYEECYRY